MKGRNARFSPDMPTPHLRLSRFEEKKKISPQLCGSWTISWFTTVTCCQHEVARQPAKTTALNTTSHESRMATLSEGREANELLAKVTVKKC